MSDAVDRSVVRGIASGGTGGEPVVMDSKDGKIVRIRPLTWTTSYTEEELEGRLWEFESRGKTFKCPPKSSPPYYALAYKNRVYSKNRVKYPLKRVDWEPGGDPEKINAHNRGRSKFKRISWDEAIQIIHDEIQRMYDTYGPSGILAIGEDGHKESKVVHYAGGNHMRLLRNLGGFVREVRTPDSVEGFYWGAKHVLGPGLLAGLGMFDPSDNIVKDVSDNTDVIVLQAGDWETVQNYAGQWWSTAIRFWLDLGIKFIVIDPFCSYTAVCHDDVKWVPLNPNTDTAFDYALMYVWITEGLYDKDFIATHTVGFDEVKAYIMGDEDGVPKTPAWASEICGVPEWTIKAVARKWGKSRTSIGHFCGAHIRGPYSHEPGRTEVYKFAMQGVGKPGVHQIHLFSFETAKGAVPQWSGGPSEYVMGHADTFYPNELSVPRTMVHHAIEKGEVSWYGSPQIMLASAEEQFEQRFYPNKDVEGAGEFHFIWSEKASNQGSWNGGFFLQDAYRNPKIETFISNHQWLENDSVFADLILPISCGPEEADVVGASMTCSVPVFAIQEPATDPVGEPKSDYEIAVEVAKTFGIEECLTQGLTIEDERRYAYDTSCMPGDITYEEWKEKGYYIPPFVPNWQDIPAGMYNFYNDPENYPLQTPSGKLELFSQALADHFPDDKERQPIAKWIQGGPEEEGWSHDETLLGEKAKTYPLSLNSSPGRWRVHCQNDDVVWLREIATCKVKGPDGYLYEPCWLAAEDASARGIEDGDIVKVFNDQGTILCGAVISERVLPRTVKIDKGARVDPIAPHIDRGGSTNLISPPGPISKNCWGFAVTGYLVEVAKLDDAEMEQWKKDYPDAFERAYDPASGSHYDGWVEGAE
ncbi:MULTISPECIES: molybdopterin-dependent oxidoreductase [unclassified Adlercreutzia]|uniref:molybdopterin-dependent oxidoreductase n=1 Tax=unclassified Adlercreutzia TaxID=2636013 RepID=UPI0013EBC565|nr:MULTISPECIES: molybdopterin-dependent oxidoreductase [unclassified Adlercreutzia]